MRITLTLDDDLAVRLPAEALERGCPFEVVVNELLRASLAERPSAASAVPFRVEPVSLGAPRPGHDDHRIGALLEEIEGLRLK